MKANRWEPSRRLPARLPSEETSGNDQAGDPPKCDHEDGTPHEARGVVRWGKERLEHRVEKVLDGKESGEGLDPPRCIANWKEGSREKEKGQRHYVHHSGCGLGVGNGAGCGHPERTEGPGPDDESQYERGQSIQWNVHAVED